MALKIPSSGVLSSHVVNSMHPPSLAGWADIPPARVHFMCINKKNSYGPFDLPCGDLMKNEGFTNLLNVSFIRLLFSISSLPWAPTISMEYNVLILSRRNLMILKTEQKSLLFFDAKETEIYTNLANSMANDILQGGASYPLNIYVYALRAWLDWYISKVKSKTLVFVHILFSMYKQLLLRFLVIAWCKYTFFLKILEKVYIDLVHFCVL